INTWGLSGVLAADTANVTASGGTATFANANAGTGKTVSSTPFTLSGSAAGNYTLSSVNSTLANISALDVTGSFTAANKQYDGTNSATINSRTLSGVLAGDT